MQQLLEKLHTVEHQLVTQLQRRAQPAASASPGSPPPPTQDVTTQSEAAPGRDLQNPPAIAEAAPAMELDAVTATTVGVDEAPEVFSSGADEHAGWGPSYTRPEPVEAPVEAPEEQTGMAQTQYQEGKELRQRPSYGGTPSKEVEDRKPFKQLSRKMSLGFEEGGGASTPPAQLVEEPSVSRSKSKAERKKRKADGDAAATVEPKQAEAVVATEEEGLLFPATVVEQLDRRRDVSLDAAEIYDRRGAAPPAPAGSPKRPDREFKGLDASQPSGRFTTDVLLARRRSLSRMRTDEEEEEMLTPCKPHACSCRCHDEAHDQITTTP
eukprot:GHVT01034838.1.p1 GENE.GHVT01034838.1~~GHVT01034838.1.p1  ORF type:complete len:324 (-),score=81.62 GHVT01034838.1:1599-2570(-)